ncbi:uncharacterized protein LOC135212403 [Macrobrachium nipponense]|uniref:uncharacterized protein LOC135212403 n=1 Tax=Macrobrachium nipponense TaxID=159736 RepID=UPI0030C828C6
MSVPPKVFRDTLAQVSGKMLTPVDINNLKQKLRMEDSNGATDVTLLMETLDNILEQEPGSYVEITIGDDGKITNIFIQLPFMKEALVKFPEVLLLDGTYRINNTKMPLYTFMVEYGYGCSIPVGHFFVANENMETIAAGFESLKKSVGVKILSQNQVFLVDKDFTEIGLVRKYFPESAIHLCLFHVFKTFRSETTKILGKNRNEITELVEKIVYCSTEETYEELYAQLLVKTTSQFEEYLKKKNWHECRHMWVSAWRKKTVTFGNRTTNRLESFHHKLKEVMKSMQSVAECVRGLVRFSNRKEFEIEHRRFLSKSTVAYCASANHEGLDGLVVDFPIV